MGGCNLGNCGNYDAAAEAFFALSCGGDLQFRKLQKGDATTEAQPWHFVRNAVLGQVRERFGVLYAKRSVGEGLAPPVDIFAI